MKTATKKPAQRIYSASAASYVLEIVDSADKRIGTLTINPGARNALVWLRARKQKVSEKTKTLLNLVEWMEAED